jgi:hypothetical protein
MIRKVVDMRRFLTRPVVIAVMAVLVVAATAGAAVAMSQSSDKSTNGGSSSSASGFTAAPGSGVGLGPAGFGQGGGFRGGPFGAGGFFGRGVGGFGPGGMGGGGTDVLSADILDPAATYLGISLPTLESDLAGGKTLAQEVGSGKTTSGLISAIVAAEQTVLDAEKAAGWLTANQESALVTSFTNGVTSIVNNGPPVPRPGGPQAGGLLQTAATYLDLSLSTLQSDLSSGKTLADVATGQGDTVSGLVTALLAPDKTRLDSEVSAGRITASQESTLLANLTTRLTNLVNGTKGSAGLAAIRSGLASIAFGARRG